MNDIDTSGNIATSSDEFDRRLQRHLQHWLGQWPPGAGTAVISSVLRDAPGWDGRVRPITGVATPSGTVISVSPALFDEVRIAVENGGLDELDREIGRILMSPDGGIRLGVFRSSRALVDVDDVGMWVATDDPRVPEWLRPFNGDVLVAFDEAGQYAAGVGRKRHDDFGQELAVATEPAHRRRGLARSLIAQAAKRVFDEGAIATYLHRPDNEGSAAVADAAGFPDLGWKVVGTTAGV